MNRRATGRAGAARTDESRRVHFWYDPRSLGIRRYVDGLAEALPRHGWRPAALHEADVVNVHVGNSSRQLARLVRPARRPLVATLHDVVPRHRMLRAVVGAGVARAWMRRSAAVVVHTATGAALAGGSPVLVPHWARGPDAALPMAEARRRLGLPAGQVIVGVFGRAAAHKGTTTLAAALQGRSRTLPRTSLLVVGPGAGDSARGLAWPRTHVLEAPDDATYDVALAAIDALVALRTDTVGEASGPVAQALGLGIPVLFAAGGPLADQVRAGGVGVRDSAELAKALESLERPDRLATLRQAAATEGRRASLDEVAARYAAIFTQALRTATP